MSETRIERIGLATLHLGDCRDVLPTLGVADALVTDPPYGIGESAQKNRSRGRPSAKWRAARPTDYGDFDWDEEPVDDVLMGLVRRSGRSQIIFGGNYYALPPTACWLVWDKETNGDFADCELAWTNLPMAVRRLRYLWNGFARANNEPRGDHPTQKPVGVMRWCLGHLPKDCRTVVDPFMGSGTTGVAAMEMGLRFVGIERVPRYFETACRRIEVAQRQGSLFIDGGAV